MKPTRTKVAETLRRTLHVSVGVPALLLACPGVSQAKDPAEPGFPAGIRMAAPARGEAAVAALGGRLPEVAAFHGRSARQLRSVFRADPSLWVDEVGQLFYACPAQCTDCGPEHGPEGDGVLEIGPTDPGPFDTSQAFLLHSRPGADRVIYLDFDGHVDDTPGNWKEGAYAPPYNIPNSNPNSFSTEERNRIIEIWQRVAEDFSMYQIDVTTEEPDIEDLRKTDSGDARYGIRVCIGGSGQDWFGRGVGGVAYVGSFDAGNDVPCWVFPAGSGYTAKNVAEAASHEAGHTLGLIHDGIEGGAGYYSGQGFWGTIMGVSYDDPISQWSKGEYADANNTQDDLAVMLTQGAVYRPDDHGGTLASATELGADSGTASVAGVIEQRTDVDFFRIEAAGGLLEVNADPAPRGANLRIEVKLYDAAGALLETATSEDTSAGTQPVILTRTVAGGSYYFSVDGIGNGDPLTTGYTDYASLGQYEVVVSGVVPLGFTWLPVTAGTYPWSDASNWVAGSVPGGAGATVRMNHNISGDQTVLLAGPTALGRLTLGDSNGTHAFTLASGGGSLVFDNSGSASSLSRTTGADDVISVPLSLEGPLDINQSASGTLEFTGGIGGGGSLSKSGAGTLVFGGPNTYTGATTLADGLLRLDDSEGFPGGIDDTAGPGESVLFLKGGVLGLHGDFTRQLGTGPGQLNWDPGTGGAGSGGFAAFGADRQVRLNNGTGAFSWQTGIIGPQKTLVLGDPEATHTLRFRNGISFAGSQRTVMVKDGLADVDAVLAGKLTGGNSSGLIKSGAGVLSISSPSNDYTGATIVRGGMLRLEDAGALPGGNLTLQGGGLLGLGAGDLVDRTIGAGINQLRWSGDGGFAAFGADRVVRFSPEQETSGSSSINWNAPNFIGAGQVLILGHETADATIDWQHRISLAGSTRIIQVEDGSALIDAKMSGIVAGGTSANTNNRFNKTGPGTLAFTAQNSYWGNTIVSAGTLMIGDGGSSGGVSKNSAEIIVEAGATLAVNRADTVTQGSDPFPAPISGDGGFVQTGSGNTVLMLANSYIGPTVIEAGTLTLGAAGVLPDGTEVVIGNAILDAGSVSEIMGRLDVTDSATIHFGAGSSLAFADSRSIDWAGGTLDLTGAFISGASLRFGIDANGLTAAQLARISATGFSDFALNDSGFLTATELTGYAVWAAINAPGGAPGDDFDEDGVSNGIEYVLGGDTDTNDLAKLPSLSRIGGDMVFSFLRDQESIDGSTLVAIEISPDMTDWSDSRAVPDGASVNNPGVTVVKDLPVPGTDTVTLTLPLGDDVRKFARLVVTP
ncbi:autotransporter-associated beta strand repeat-containing protein [Haloferula sp. A504]|uniref:autotransporter-associated beta strand repeat-containing protein n=1 Tax=Haloferula sp. A504 TaxID=3373601 RepID=UPI0031C2E233|nr:autotransporter-associated beta strand repeat-containing protein [Verrucomicrobiaceae bacterium E54]